MCRCLVSVLVCASFWACGHTVHYALDNTAPRAPNETSVAIMIFNDQAGVGNGTQGARWKDVDWHMNYESGYAKPIAEQVAHQLAAHLRSQGCVAHVEIVSGGSCPTSSFCINGKLTNYLGMLERDMETHRSDHAGRLTNAVIGFGLVGLIAAEVANYQKLPDPPALALGQVTMEEVTVRAPASGRVLWSGDVDGRVHLYDKDETLSAFDVADEALRKANTTLVNTICETTTTALAGESSMAVR